MATESPLKIMEKAFYFTSKTLFVLKILSFVLTLSLVAKRLVRKIKSISKFMTSQPGKQTIVIHVLPNILRNKDNQTMKPGQLREYNMRNIFLEKPYTKCDGETSPRPFSEKLKLSISLDRQSGLLFSSFRFVASPSG